MPSTTNATLIETVRETAHRLTGATGEYDPLMDLIGDARFVLLGEASHGTHEFYHERALITQRLIEEKGFTAVAVEADWPDAYRVNRYVRGASDDVYGVEALADFRRFPAWMWRNTDVVEFVEWLRVRNDSLPVGGLATGFYGLDLYSLHVSMEAVVRFLEKVDPEAAKQARTRYACFDHFGRDTQVYGFVTGTGLARSCEDEVVTQLVELQRRAMEYARRDGRPAEEEVFYAEQNARLVKNAEVVWAHNSHVGDARATEMSERGELNVGQLARERYGRDALRIGFTTDHGTVTAASDWGGPAERKRVRSALPDSYEAAFHETRLARFLLTGRDVERVPGAVRDLRLERAIGVIYRPETERASHYFYAWLPEQFDAVLHFDETRAVEPLERTSEWDVGEPPETFPSGV